MSENILEELKESLKKIENSPHTELTNFKILKVNKNTVKVSFLGHEVGGSYVYDYEVAPSYIKTIEYETNYKSEWTGRGSGSIGLDMYFFTIYTNKIFNKNKYIPEGEIFHFDKNASFPYDGGITWAYLYSMVKDIKENKTSRLKEVGVEIIKDILIIDNVEISKIVNFKKEEGFYIQGHNMRRHVTYFNATFDLLVGEFVFRLKFFNKYRDIVNLVLKEENEDNECLMVTNDRCESSWAEYISMKFSKSEPFEISSNISFFNKDLLENMKWQSEKKIKDKEIEKEELEWDKWRERTKYVS